MWDTRYRPLKYADVLGQEGNVQILRARLRNGSALDTSYIFSGGHGQGKTTLARIHARAMLCEQLVDPKGDPEPCNTCDNCMDVLREEGRAFVEKDAASNGTIDHARAIVDELPFAVFGAPKRVYLFDEAHRMSRDAQDVFLKPIEDKRMIGMFCTTEPDKIRGTIRSRCEEYTIRKVTREEILARMQTVLRAEGVDFDDEAVLMVIDFSGGHVRDVLNRLEMVSQMGRVSAETVREYLNLGVVSTYYEILLALHDPRKAVALVEQACERSSPDETVSGISEAAMNAYRLANGMHTDLIYVDRNLAGEVYKRYGVHALRLSEYFLRGRALTQAGLLSDVLLLSQAQGNLPPMGPQPPIVFVAQSYGGPAPVSAPAPTPPVAAPTPTPAYIPENPGDGPVEAATPPAEVAPAPPPPPAPAPPPPPATPRDPLLRFDGVGSLGSSDQRALTEVDHIGGVPLDFPRGHDESKKSPRVPLKFAPTKDDELLPMQADAWRREFERTWPGAGGGGG
jgi:DNA polymerase-3 subunit gamma/tau